MEFYRQQDFDTESLRLHGCGLAAIVNARVAASDGRFPPEDDDGTQLAKLHLERSGATTAQFNARGLTSTEVFRSLQAIGSNDEWMDLPVKQYRGGRVADMLERMEDVGGCLLVAIRNRVLAKAGKSPFPTFMGGHWGVVLSRDGGTVRFVDSGRKVPITLPVSLLTDAMDQFGDKRDVGLADDSWGDGRGEGILVWPWKTWRQGYGEMKAKRDKALVDLDRTMSDLGDAQEALEACQAGGPGADQLAAARAQGIADAAERARTTV